MDDTSSSFLVKIEVKTCTIDHVSMHLKRFCNKSYGNNVVVRNVGGVVLDVGRLVTRFKAGDEVLAVLPVNHYFDIKQKQCSIEEYFVVLKPQSISFEISSCCLVDGFRAYNALHYLGRLRPGNTLLICNATSSFGVICAQLARSWGIKVFTTAANEDDAQMLRSMSLEVERTLTGHQYLRNMIKDETGGLGIDCIVDDGVLPNLPDTSSHDFKMPMKHDLISSLAVCGRWVTSQHNLQLDPPDSETLHFKSASICHLFPDALLLSTYKQNEVIHILDDVLDKANEGILRPHFMSVIPATDLNVNIFPTNQRIVLKL